MEQEQTSASSAKPERISVQYGVDTTTVTFTEEKIIDEEQIQELRKALGQVIEKNRNKQLILDFTNIKLINSILLNLLIRVRKEVEKVGGQIRLSNLEPNLRRILDLTHLTKVFDIS
jgi:stage II sporulation protein AA (anti-sigma F factor antagonist)